MADQDQDFPMPKGVEAMTKQQLWNWLSRSFRAQAEIDRSRKWYMTTVTGEPMPFGLSDANIINLQRNRIAGLKTQMRQMNRGYRKKIAKLEAQLSATSEPTE